MNLSQCTECGSNVNLSLDEFHSDDSGEMHSDCYDTYIDRSQQDALGSRYVQQTREQIYEAAARSSFERYGFSV